MGFLQKLKAARMLPSVEAWLEQSQAEEKVRVERALAARR
jgi:hypothetical protein